jgi:DNA-binding CsgD family transcriptional regulator
MKHPNHDRMSRSVTRCPAVAGGIGTHRSPLRALGLDARTESAYRGLLEHPDWTAGHLSAHLATDSASAEQVLGRLQELDLVRAAAGGQLEVVDPRVGLPALAARLDAELAQRREQLEQGRLAIADLVAGLGSPRDPNALQVADVAWGAPEIVRRISRLAAAASTEVVAMCTPRAALVEAMVQSRRPEGICCRLVVAIEERTAPDRERWWRAVADGGAQVRVGAVPTSALIVDSTTVALPIADGNGGRTVGLATLRLPSAVTAVVELFERVWADAPPLPGTPEAEQAGLSPRERDLLDLLVAGTTDESAASRLGISVRTVRRMVSDLMGRLGARSRFEAGARAAERGWLHPSMASR